MAEFDPVVRHSGARAQRGSPESDLAGTGTGFRVRRFRARPGMTLLRRNDAQNFTCGACSSTLRSSPTSKNSFGVKPIEPANSAAGNCWMPVLYSCTALLKNRRAAAILFSMSESSRLQLLEVLAGLEVRIGLAQREQLPERAAQHVLRRRLRRHAAALRGDRGVARRHHGFERAALVGGIALHRLDQIRNEVVPLLGLHVDVGERLVDPLPHRDQPVVDHDDPQPRAGRSRRSRSR